MAFNKMILKGFATVASVVALAACGGRQASNTPSTNNNSSTDTKTLKIYADEGYVKFIDQVKESFEKDNNVKLEIVTGDGLKGLENLSLDNQAGHAPDVMMAPFDRVGSLARTGDIAEIKLGQASELDDTAKTAVTVEGKTYGEPTAIETVVLFYNKDLVSEAPKTFADLEALNKDSRFAFSNESGKYIGFLAPFTNYYHTYGLLSGHGAYVFGKQGTDAKDLGVGNQGAVKGLEYQKTFYDVWPQGMQDAENSGNFVSNNFLEGKTAAIIDGPWAVSKMKDAKVNFGAAIIPTLPNGNHYKSFGGGKAWIVPSSSKHKELANKFISYLTNETNAKVFFDTTSEVPANTKARAYASSKNDAVVNAVISQFAYTEPMPSISEMAEVWEPAATMLFENGSGKKSAQQAADDATKLIKEQIEQKYGSK